MKKNTNTSTTDIQDLGSKFYDTRDENIFRKIVNEMTGPLSGYLHRMIKDTDTVNSVISLTFEKVYYTISKYDRASGKFCSWVYKIAHNCAIDAMREIQAREKTIITLDCADQANENGLPGMKDETEEPDAAYVDGTLEIISEEKIRMDIIDASTKSVELLPPEMRLVVKERFYENKKLDEIAYEHSIPLSSVKNWIFRAKQLIKENLEYQYKEELERYQMVLKKM